jgi:hypothetical protein
MTPDHINAAFELFGAVFTWRNALQLHRDKQIKGVYWPITAFFAAWGVWNLYYYPAIGQMLSFYAGMILVLGNIIWVVQAVMYSRRDRGCPRPPAGWVCTRKPGHDGPCAAVPE